jgi:hypothetical protein
MSWNETHYLEQARDALTENDHATARRALEQAVAINPDSEFGWLWMSVVAKDTDEEIACLEKVLQINSENTKAQNRLATIIAAPKVKEGKMVETQTQVIFDRRDQLSKIQQLVVGNETLYAVFDLKGGGTGFVGITDLRLIFMDQAFLKKQKAIVSVPFTRITAVGSEDSGKIILSSILGSSTLFVVAGNREWTFEFRSNEKAHQAYDLIMRNLLQLEAKGL